MSVRKMLALALVVVVLVQLSAQGVEAEWRQTYMTGEWVQVYDSAPTGSMYALTIMGGDWVSTYDN